MFFSNSTHSEKMLAHTWFTHRNQDLSRILLHL